MRAFSRDEKMNILEFFCLVCDHDTVVTLARKSDGRLGPTEIGPTTKRLIKEIWKEFVKNHVSLDDNIAITKEEKEWIEGEGA